MADKIPLKFGYSGADPNSIDELTSSDNAKIPGTIEVVGHTKFEGVTSTGATGTGKIVYDTGGTTTNQTLVTPALGTPASGTLDNCTHKDMIKGDGTAGRVMRLIVLSINNGSNATTIKPDTASAWNGDANSAEDNLGKGGDTGVFELNAGGDTLTIGGAGISGDAIAVISAVVAFNASGTAVTVSGYVSGGAILLAFLNATSGAAVDLTTLVDTGGLIVRISYITSA